METLVASEAGPTGQQWAHVQETWEELRDTLSDYFGHQAEKAEFIADLNTHTATIHHFIDAYIGPDPSVVDMRGAYRMIASMHQQSIIEYAERMGFGVQNLAFLSPHDIEEKVDEIYDQWLEGNANLQETASDKISNQLTETLFANIEGLRMGFEQRRQSKGKIAAFLHAFHL